MKAGIFFIKYIIPKRLQTAKYNIQITVQLVRHLLKDYAWLKSMRIRRCVDRNGQPIPWFSYPAIDFLSQLNLKEKTVFEYGCGYSTLYWGGRTSSVISVESNLKWIEKITAEIPGNCTLVATSLDIEDYAGKINDYEEQFDIIVVDGLIHTRTACCEKAIDKVMPGGIIILDNSDRCLKSAEILRNAGFIQADFTGFAPLGPHAQTTTVFFTRDYNFQPLLGHQPHQSVAQPSLPYHNG